MITYKQKQSLVRKNIFKYLTHSNKGVNTYLNVCIDLPTLTMVYNV